MLFSRCFLALWILITVLTGNAVAADGWEAEWDRTVKAAEQEGQLVLYSLTEVGEAIRNTGFEKKIPKD